MDTVPASGATAPLVFTDPSYSGTFTATTTNTYSITATDEHGATSTTTFDINVVDNQPPTMTQDPDDQLFEQGVAG